MFKDNYEFSIIVQKGNTHITTIMNFEFLVLNYIYELRNGGINV